MRLKAITGILFTVFLLGTLTMTSSVQPVAANAVVDSWSIASERALYASDFTMGIVEELKLTIVYDNNPYDERLETAWGFGCYIQADDTTILFDTGGDAEILLENMGELNLDVGEIDVIVLSHIHDDHTGGLFGILDLNSNVTIYLPASFPDEFKNSVLAYGCEVMEVETAQKICNGVGTTGELETDLGTAIKEQALLIATPSGLIVMTGCAHPGVVQMVEEAVELTEMGVYLVIGGFHLTYSSAFQIDYIISQLKALGVQKTAPCHCSGDLARQRFQLGFGDDYIEAGLGFSLQLPPIPAVDWWPMFRHDLNHTGYSTSTAPNTNNTIWNYTTDDEVFSSPALADGKVYVGSVDQSIYCLNASTGAHIWNYTTDDEVFSSPAVASGKVYVGSEDGKVYCFNASTGAHIWNYTTGSSVGSSPTVADGKVYVGSSYPDKNVYALNATTGAYIWNYTTGDGVASSPAVVDDRVYVGSNDHKVYCLNASTGAHIWNYTTDDRVFSSPAVADGRVYIGSRDGKVYCLDALTGGYWWAYTTGDRVESSPAVADGRVYVGSWNNKVYCLNASYGMHIWNYTTGSAVFSSAAVADGKVYVGSYDSKVFCFDALTGAHIWDYTTGGSVGSSPTVVDGKVYVGSGDGKVYAFGTLVWSADSVGNLKATFDLTDNVYVRGEGFPADTNVTIYLLPDGAGASPSNAVANASVTTTSTGDLPVTLVWSQPLTLGEYDIWVDANQNGAFDGGDVWNSQAIGIYTFNVIPEFPTWTSMLLILVLVTVSLATYKRKLLKKPIH